ncbi:MAG: 3-deoxy-D-manno-octulosonic acid transferase [Crocinitomicaceae bacterium]
MWFLYSIGIHVYGVIIKVASLFNSKAKKWIDGRKDWEKRLENFERTSANIYWFHCASLGEFEQGKPIIEALKDKEDCQIIVSFFSPSGYEIRKNYDKADMVFYLPLDTKSNARKLVETIKPTKVFIVKYEFWANLISELKLKSIPVYLVSGIFRKKQSFFKWYGEFFRNILSHFTIIFVQDKASQNLLKTINVSSVITGDTRYDRVMDNSKSSKRIELVEQFCGGEKVLVVGSSWLEDDQILMPLVNSIQSKVIIAPHEIKKSRLAQIENSLDRTFVRYSEFTGEKSAEVLIIDNIGMLMHLYQYANVAYVGGGFKTGLHNILEPASFGVPVIFGPKHEKFPEAKLFIENGIGFEVSSYSELNKKHKSLLIPEISSEILSFMQSQKGATKKVVGQL